MIYISIAVFALAAIAGIVIFKNWLSSSPVSKTVIYLHGLFAVTGLVLLLVFTLQNKADSLWSGIALFGAAALGGIYMFVRGLKGKNSPIWLASIHALLAVGGVLVLVFYIL
jgi:hypothetical protein